MARGSAWAMARDIAEGYVLATERTFTQMTRAELDQLAFEIDRLMRELRAARRRSTTWRPPRGTTAASSG